MVQGFGLGSFTPAAQSQYLVRKLRSCKPGMWHSVPPPQTKRKERSPVINVCCFKLLRCREFVTQPKITNIWEWLRGGGQGTTWLLEGGGGLPLPLPRVTAGHPQEPPETPL